MRSHLESLSPSRPAQKVSGACIHHLRRCEPLNEEDVVRSRNDVHPSVRWQDGTMIFGDGSVSIRERTGLGHNCHVPSHSARARVIHQESVYAAPSVRG